MQHTALFVWLWGQGSPLAALSWCLLHALPCLLPAQNNPPVGAEPPFSAVDPCTPRPAPPQCRGWGSPTAALGQSSRKREKRLVRKPRGCSGLQVGGRKRVLKIQQRLHGPRRWLSRWRVSAATWAPADGSRGSPLRSPQPGATGGGGRGTGRGRWGANGEEDPGAANCRVKGKPLVCSITASGVGRAEHCGAGCPRGWCTWLCVLLGGEGKPQHGAKGTHSSMAGRTACTQPAASQGDTASAPHPMMLGGSAPSCPPPDAHGLPGGTVCGD